MGNKGLLVYISGEPPSVGEPILARVTSMRGIKKTLRGEVVRIEDDVVLPGRVGVAIRLHDEERESVLNLIPSNHTPVPRQLKAKADEDRWSEVHRPDLEMEQELSPSDSMPGTLKMTDEAISRARSMSWTSDDTAAAAEAIADSRAGRPSPAEAEGPSQPAQKGKKELKQLADDISMLLERAFEDSQPPTSSSAKSDHRQAESPEETYELKLDDLVEEDEGEEAAEPDSKSSGQGSSEESSHYLPPPPSQPVLAKKKTTPSQRIQVGEPLSPTAKEDPRSAAAPPKQPPSKDQKQAKETSTSAQIAEEPPVTARPVENVQSEPTSRPASTQADTQGADEQDEGGSFRQIGSRRGWRSPAGMSMVSRGVAPIVGIDFGTTYSKVAVFDGNEVVLVEDPVSKASSRAAVPSVVAFNQDGSHIVGEPAREMLASDPASVINSVKRVMGLSYSDPLANGLLGSLSCPSQAGPNDSILFDIYGQQTTVPQVSAKILEHLRKNVSSLVGAKVEKAVFTVPVEFDARAKRELELAARMAGLDVVAMVPEPVAAAIGCGHDGREHSFIAIYDFGGGTFDASVVEVGQQRFAVRGAAGDRWLGGDDFDEMIARHVADEFQKTSEISLHNRVEEWQRLIFACEEAKRWLSTLESVDVVLPRAALTADGPITLLVPMTRSVFEDVTEDIITSTLEVCRSASVQAGKHPRDIGTVLVTGGTTRIPSVRAAAEKFFGQPAMAGIHPEHAVVIGAAVRGALLSKVKVPGDFVDRLRGFGTIGRNVGLALAGGATEPIIQASQHPPTAALRRYSTSRDGQTTIRLELVEGNSATTAENRRIGGFVIADLPPRKAGEINLDVYFELSSTGTLYVTAQERSTGQRAQGTFDLSIL